MQWANDSLFGNWCWENWTDACQKVKLDHLLTPHTRINSKWIKDLNVRHRTIQILEENFGSKISNIACSNILSDISPQAREINKQTNKKQVDYIKLKCFCTAKEAINEEKMLYIKWKKILTKHISDKGLFSKTYKKFLQ